MFCLKKNALNHIDKINKNDIKVLEQITVDCLPYCNVCLECQDEDYEIVLQNNKIHPIMRYVYIMLNGINETIELLNYFTYHAEENREKIGVKIVKDAMDLYYRCFGLLDQKYEDIFGQQLDHEKINEEFLQKGIQNLLDEKNFHLPHLLHLVKVNMLNAHYEEVLEAACYIYFHTINTKRLSFARSCHKLFDEYVLNIGWALTEGDAEMHAVAIGRKLFEAVKSPVLNYDSKKYVIERKLFIMLLEKLNTTSEEVCHSLFDKSESFIHMPCLFPKILKYSDEKNLPAYKSAIQLL